MADVAVASSVSMASTSTTTNPLDDTIGLYRDYAGKGDLSLLQTIAARSGQITSGERGEADFPNPQDFAQICILLGTAALLRGDELKNQDKDKAKNYYETAAKLFEKAKNQRLQNLAKNKIILVEPLDRESTFSRILVGLRKFFSTLLSNFFRTLLGSALIIGYISILTILFGGPLTLLNLILSAPAMITSSGAYLTVLEGLGIFATLTIAAFAFIFYTFANTLDNAEKAYTNGSRHTDAEDAVKGDEFLARKMSNGIISTRTRNLKQEKIEESKVQYRKTINEMNKNNNITGLLIHYNRNVTGKSISVSNPDPAYVLNIIKGQINKIKDLPNLINLRDRMDFSHDDKISEILNARIKQIETANRIPRAQEQKDASAEEKARLVRAEMGEDASELDDLSSKRRLTRKTPTVASSSISSLSASIGIAAPFDVSASSVPTPTVSASLSAESSSSLSGSITITNENQYPEEAKAASTSIVQANSESLSVESSTSSPSEEEKKDTEENGMELADLNPNRNIS